MNGINTGAKSSSSPRIAIVGYPGHAMVSRLCLELQRRGRSVTLVTPDQVVTEVRGNEVLVHPFCDQAPFSFVLLTVSTDEIAALQGLSALERTYVPIANTTNAVMRAADKFATAQVLASAGVRVPLSMSVCTEGAAQVHGQRLGYPFVLKAADGSEGSQVSLVTDPGELSAEIVRIRASLGLAPSVKSSLILQEVVSGGLGRDRRLFVVGGNVQAAMDRVARGCEWRSNMSRGATPVAADPTPEEVHVAVTAATALELDFGTIDIMYDDDGPVVIEANPFGDVLDVAMTSGMDLIGSVADLVDIFAGLRADSPIVARPLPREERTELSNFCWDRLRRRIAQLEAERHRGILNADACHQGRPDR